MYRVLGSGGLGDSAIILMQTKLLCEYDDFEITHVMKHNTLLKSVKEFYDSQNIKSNVMKINDWSWLEKNKKNFNFHAKISGDLKWKRMNIYPKYIVNNAKSYDVLISPTAGRDNDRKFSIQEIEHFCKKYKNRKIGLIGKTRDIYRGVMADNLINKTSIKETLSLINSSKTIVAPAGFISILASSMNKDVFTKDHSNVELIRKTYYNPKWSNNSFIKKLSDVKI